MEEYEFGVLEDRIISLCEAARPDYEAICRQIEDSANVNAVNKYGEAFLFKILFKLGAAEYWRGSGRNIRHLF